MADPNNDYKQGDSEHNILRKILGRLKELLGIGGGDVTLTVSDVEIGAVEMKDSATDDRARVINVDPTNEFGVVVRNIPSGTQPISAATLPLPIGAATEATLASGFSAVLANLALESTLGSIDSTLDTNLSTRASEATLAAISANINVPLSDLLTATEFNTRINTLGQKSMVLSTPVVIASNQSALPVTQSGTWSVLATQSGSWNVGAVQSGTWTVNVIQASAWNVTASPSDTPNTVPWLVSDDWRRSGNPRRFAITVQLTPGAATAGTNLFGLRKQNSNGDCYIIRIRCHVFHAAAGVACVLGWKRATTVAGGSQITAADIPKIDTNAGNATLEVRTGAVTAGAEAAQYMITHAAHSTAAPAAGVGSPWIDEWLASDRSGSIRLTGDEGLILEQITAGDTDNRYFITVEWEEVT